MLSGNTKWNPLRNKEKRKVFFKTRVVDGPFKVEPAYGAIDADSFESIRVHFPPEHLPSNPKSNKCQKLIPKGKKFTIRCYVLPAPHDWTSTSELFWAKHGMDEDSKKDVPNPFVIEFTVEGEKAQCLVFGQSFRIQLQLKCDERVTVHNVHWKLSDSFEHSDTRPLASVIEQHFQKLKIKSVDPGDFTNTYSIWMKVPNASRNSPMLRETEHCSRTEDEHRTQLGDVVVEWSSALSFEHIRSVLALPAMPPVLAIPITVDVGLITPENQQGKNIADESAELDADGCFFRILQPFRLRYCLRNTSGEPLAVHLQFGQTEGVAVDGIVEDSFLLFPSDERAIEQCVVPISLGFVSFPRPTIRCISSIPDCADLEFCSEDLEQLNHLITRHSFKSIPEQLFILP